MLRFSVISLILTASFVSACKSPPPDAATPANNPTVPTSEDDKESQPALSPAQALAQQVFEALGGSAFSNINQIHFTFDVRNGSESTFAAKHSWNLVNHTDQIQWTTPDSTKLDVLINLETDSVEGTANNSPITDEQRPSLAADAKKRWVNDSYWLLMPLKLRDPGVILTLESPREIDSTMYQVLHMTFENVGLTPGDQYWVYVDPDTYHVARWDMLLQGQETDPTTVLWKNYQKVGPLTLPTTRSWPDSPKQIVFENTRIEMTEN